MGDRRFGHAYERLSGAPDREAQLRLLPDEDLVEALAGSAAASDRLVANVVATELLNRRRSPRGGVPPGTLAAAAREIGHADHICLVYETKEEQFAAAIPYIAEGLARNERCIYIVDESTGAEVAAALEAEGVDVGTAVASGALSILPQRDAYLRGDRFEPDGMIAYLSGAVEDALRHGYAGVRITGEMTWALGSGVEPACLLEYESKLNRFFPGSRASAICQYNRRRFPPEIVLDVLRTHPRVVYGGLVCTNSYYVPPDEFLGEHRAEREVDRLLENIREREDAALRMRLLNRELEGRVEERTRELQNAYRELEAFSYSVSHDLRAPLRGVDALLAALAQDHGDALDAEARRLLDRARGETTRLTALVNGLLTLSRVARDELVARPLDLTALAREVAGALAEAHPERRVAFTVDEGLAAEGDERLVRVVFDNLLGNAWKFTRGVEAPRVHVGIAQQRGRTAFYVRDNGVGFDPGDAARLFVPFQRLRSDIEGTGIGLATVRRVVLRHGGAVWADGARGRGATVWFTLPEVDAPPPENAYIVAAASPDA